MKKQHSAVLNCVGAVIGAGFASGREIVIFFTQYGWHGWWLIVLAALLMAGLCALCMRTAQLHEGDWMQLVAGKPAKICPLLLMTLTAGAMISASGHMVALLWNHPKAYVLGVLGTMLAAWLMGNRNLKMLNVLSGILTLMLISALMASLIRLPAVPVQVNTQNTPVQLAMAATRAVGYAALNMTLAMGVVCRSAQQIPRIWPTAGMFGCLIGVLMMIGQSVYSRQPLSAQKAFPMLALLNEYGRTGYITGVLLLYLAIVTTLTSVLYALRAAAESRIPRSDLRLLMVPGIPLAVSGFGFESIVDRLYAPAGLVCLFAVFVPLVFRTRKRSGATFS